MGDEDVLAVAEAPEEGERGVEDAGPDQQHAGHGQTRILLRRVRSPPAPQLWGSPVPPGLGVRGPIPEPLPESVPTLPPSRSARPRSETG